MNPAAFFRAPDVLAYLERASCAGAVPVSVHYVDHDEEGPRVVSFGRCEACRHVAGLPGGVKACRASRLSVASEALRRRIPVPFICHMGFGCVSAAALPGTDLGYTLTFGPYCPAEAPEVLQSDALRGLDNLDAPEQTGVFPVSLDDIRVAPTESVPALAEWAAESLDALWRAGEEDVDATAAPEPAETPVGPSRQRAPGPGRDPYQARAIAAALAGGNRPQARALVRSALAETASGKRATRAEQRARASAIAAAALEAAEAGRLDTAGAWERFNGLAEAVANANDADGLVSAAMDALGAVRGKPARGGTAAEKRLAALDAIIRERIQDRLMLKDVARELNENPTTITHQLQRKFGLSFTQYTNRLRIDKAKELLRRTRIGIGEVARRVGFSDASNFGKAFRRFEGMSPGAYRERYGQKR